MGGENSTNQLQSSQKKKNKRNIGNDIEPKKNGGERGNNQPQSSQKNKNKINIGNDIEQKKRLSNNEGSIDKGINNINNINNINDNKNNNEEKDNGKEAILETLIRIFCFEEEFKELCSDKNSKNNDFGGIIIPKKIIENYKQVYFYEYLKTNFSSNILKFITVNKKINYKILNKANLQIIIKQIVNNEKFINSIEKKRKNNPIKEIIKEAEWNYKILETTENKKAINKKLLIDFEIIDYEIFLLLINQKIETSNFLFVDYFIYNKKVLVLIKDVGDSDNVFCEVGEYNAKDGIIIESILDTREIGDSKAFKDKLINNETHLNKKTNNKKEINFNEFKNLIARGLKVNYSKIKNWIRKKDKKNIKNNQINSINNNNENFIYNKNNLIGKEEMIKPKGDNNDLILDENQNSENSQEKGLIEVPSMNSKREEKEDNQGTNIINNDTNNIINLNSNNVNQNQIDESIQKSNSESNNLIDLNNNQENKNKIEDQNKNGSFDLEINKIILSHKDNNDIQNQRNNDSSSKIPQNQNLTSEINITNETHDENVVNSSKLRQLNLNKNKNKIGNNNPPENESLEKQEVGKNGDLLNRFEIKDLGDEDEVKESGNSNLENSNNDTQINANNNINVIENPEGLKSIGDVVEAQKEEQNNVNNSQETEVAQNKNDTKNEQIRAIVENDNKGSDNVVEEPPQDESQLEEMNLIDIVKSSSNNDTVDNNNNKENFEIPRKDKDLEINAEEQKNDNKGNKNEKLNEMNVNAGPEKNVNNRDENNLLPGEKPITTEESNILSEVKDINNNREKPESEKTDKKKVEQNKPNEPNEKENDILNSKKANGELNHENDNEGNEKKDKNEEELKKEKEKEIIDKEKKEEESHPSLSTDDKKKEKAEVKFNDKEDSGDKNEESTELQDEVSETVEVSPNIKNIEKEELKDKEDSGDKNEETENPDEVGENAEVSPNINNIEKEEIKDKEDSVDKNEENADLPDDVIEIAEVSQNISEIKKEDSIQDSADNKEETEQPDEVGEIADVSPNMDCIEKEELKDKKDSVDQNEESIGLPDELFEIAEPSPNINCIEKEKPIEDTTDKNEETESPDEVGEIAEVSPDMNCIEKEELKDKTDSVDTNDKSIENPDEVNENAGASPSISENNKNDNVDKQVQDQPSHIILKKFSLPHRKLNAKTKQLLLFSIYQKKTTETKSNRNDIKENEDVILINKEFFEKYFYKEIFDLVSDDNEFKDEINNIDVNNFSISSIKNIIIRLDNDKLNAVNDKISNVNEDEVNSLLKPKEEEVSLMTKEIKIYNEFVVINRQIFTDFEKIFNINLEPQNISYILFNKDFILKPKDNVQTSLILGHFNKENSSNEVRYILDFKMQEDFNSQSPMVYSYGVDMYVNDKLMFERGLENDYISPIFNFEHIIGYGYKYDPKFNDYTKLDNYIRFLNCENLDNIITLFSYEMLYEEKKKSQQLFVNGKYYLVNQEYYNYFKKMYNYNLISKIISPYEPENLKNLYTFIKKVPSNKLDMYWNYKMEEVLFDKNSESYYMVEPESIIVNYNKDKQVISYDNFLLIDEKSGKAFSDNKESSHICCECTFIDGKIIIDLPNYLNHSGMVPKCVSIIGNLYVDRCFKIEYILIYVTEAGRKNHLDSIKNNLKENLRNLKFKDNIYTFNFQSNEVTIIKYKKKDNFKLETYFKQRPKIGLDNIGATCYMNSTLQCLTHIDGLVDYFKYDPQIEEVKQNHQNLSSSFKTLVDNLYPDILTSNRYAPHDFKEKISVMNPLFKGIAANDAKDLVNFIIMTLHNELNKKDEIPDENKDLPQNPDQSNKEQSYLSFENEILREHRSIISDLFYGINRNETQCCNCGKNIYNYQTYFFINFPLEVVRQYRAQKMSNNMMFQMNQMNQMNQFNSNEVDIIDCFENEEKITTLAGENSMYCNGCRQNAPSNMRTVLITGPEELILILNRGKGKEFDIKLNFTENLNLYKFIEKKETGYKYKLTGVITHLGESSMSGHFIAFCKDQTNKKWYKYNDSMVDEIKDFEKEVVNNSNIMPYLLFYHKLNQTKK